MSKRLSLSTCLLAGALASPLVVAGETAVAPPQGHKFEMQTQVEHSAAAQITVSAAYVRAVPPGQPNSAAFMVLSNAGNAAHAVVEAQSPVSEVVELHTHVMEEGMMQMRKVPQIEVPAGGQADLKPGGLHVMLIGLKQDLKPGDSVPLTLIFEDGSQAEVTAPVKEIGMEQAAPAEHAHQHMPGH